MNLSQSNHRPFLNNGFHIEIDLGSQKKDNNSWQVTWNTLNAPQELRDEFKNFEFIKKHPKAEGIYIGEAFDFNFLPLPTTLDFSNWWSTSLARFLRFILTPKRPIPLIINNSQVQNDTDQPSFPDIHWNLVPILVDQSKSSIPLGRITFVIIKSDVPSYKKGSYHCNCCIWLTNIENDTMKPEIKDYLSLQEVSNDDKYKNIYDEINKRLVGDDNLCLIADPKLFVDNYLKFHRCPNNCSAQNADQLLCTITSFSKAQEVFSSGTDLDLVHQGNIFEWLMFFICDKDKMDYSKTIDHSILSKYQKCPGLENFIAADVGLLKSDCYLLMTVLLKFLLYSRQSLLNILSEIYSVFAETLPNNLLQYLYIKSKAPFSQKSNFCNFNTTLARDLLATELLSCSEKAPKNKDTIENAFYLVTNRFFRMPNNKDDWYLQFARLAHDDKKLSDFLDKLSDNPEYREIIDIYNHRCYDLMHDKHDKPDND